MPKNAIKNTPISSIMSTDLHTVTSKDGLHKAKEQFDKFKIRHLPVVDDDKLVGILSLTDLKRLAYDSAFDDDDMNVVDLLTVGNVMQSKPVTVAADDSVYMVSELLTKTEFHAVPVKDGAKTVGIVTTTDIIKYFLKIIS